MFRFNHTICETKNYIIGTIEKPHINREDGGHIIIACKRIDIIELENMSSPLLHEMVDLASICGASMKRVLIASGIEIGVINYQINGNWSANKKERDPIHLHIYGRAIRSEVQPYGHALRFPNYDTGFYDKNRSLTCEDVESIRRDILNNDTLKGYI